MRECPHCHDTEQQVKAGFNRSGSQVYKCNPCNPRYTPIPAEQGYPQPIRLQAIRLYVEGINFRRIARLLQVSHVSVMNWVKAHADQLPPLPHLMKVRCISWKWMSVTAAGHSPKNCRHLIVPSTLASPRLPIDSSAYHLDGVTHYFSLVAGQRQTGFMNDQADLQGGAGPHRHNNSRRKTAVFSQIRIVYRLYVITLRRDDAYQVEK